VWTPFLRFLVAAEKSHRSGESVAWFIILDEMNLARVEYYFADLLSVLESGRDSDGRTREPLRLDYPEEVEGDLPPRELHLPQNLFFIGTVNMDETTHAFSPKVLDRAFTIEFVDVDFGRYPPQFDAAAPRISSRQRQELLQAFMLDGSAGRVEKEQVAAIIDVHPDVRYHLQNLNTALKPYGMHFGYRVFDEVSSFLAAAERNSFFTDLGGFSGAFDAAVLMKVLPKFHGSRGRLEGPLRAVLGWCLTPEAPDLDRIAKALESVDSASAAIEQLGGLPYRYPRTAQRAQLMIYALYTDGFAAFG
jgi:5-methylcytosine-specific restriction protein B